MSEKNITPAPWWRRVAALGIDLTILGLLANMLLIALEEHPWWNIGGRNFSGREMIVAELSVVVAATLYYPPVVWRMKGQSIGKKLLRIAVINDDGNPPGLVRIALREVVMKVIILDAMVVIGSVGFAISEIVFILDGMWPLWDRGKRALHDRLACTRVITQSSSKVSHYVTCP